MRLFFSRKDGGQKSTVTGFWIIEWKSVFSIVILCFHKGSREAFHSHAFNAFTIWFKGCVIETTLEGDNVKLQRQFVWEPIRFKFTPRGLVHKVFGIAEKSYCISFRGPWAKTWKEVLPGGEIVTLAHGRVEVKREQYL